MTDRKIEISISPALEAAMPDLASVWKDSAKGGVVEFFNLVPIPDLTPNGELERIATERYNAMTVRPKLPRDEVIAMIAVSLVDEAKDTILEKVAMAVLAPPQKTLSDLIADVRAADKVHEAASRMDLSSHSQTTEGNAWRAKMDARAILRSAIYENLGVNIDDLKELTRG